MPAPSSLPDHLLHGPFTAADALHAGVSEKVLRGKRFVRMFPRVWVHVAHVMTRADELRAAELAAPHRAHLSHLSRIQRLGLDIGPRTPYHFTVAGDLHIALDDVFVHRTEVLPPLDGDGVTPAAAFVQVCATMRMIDAIMIGDWLLHRHHMTVLEVAELARRDPWRPGAAQALRVLPHLDAAARSVKESETRAVMTFSGLPRPEVNVDLVVDGRWLGCVDLLLRLWRFVVEYEGRQHAETIDQFNRDITRYAGFRDSAVTYVQVTSEMLGRPRRLVVRIHELLCAAGYDGPPPVFGARWRSLFAPISTRPGGAPASKKSRLVDAGAPRRGRGGR